MSEANKQLARKWFDEVWNKQRREAIAEMMEAHSILHEGPDEVRGPEGFYTFYDRMQAAFSNIKVTIHDTIAEDDRVCVRWSCTMEHTGEGFGMAPTQRPLQATGMSIITFVNGRFHEGWQNWDMLGLMQQINGEALAPTYVAHSRATA